MKLPVLFMAGQSWHELKRRPCSYCVSFFSVLLVVAASCVSQSIIDRAPLIFLKSAEGNAGEQDIVLSTNSIEMKSEDSNSPQYLMAQYSYHSGGYLVDFLNLTQIRTVLGEKSEWTSPRTTATVNISSITKTCGITLNPSSRPTIGSNAHAEMVRNLQLIGTQCLSSNIQVKLYAIDTNKEKNISLGWEYPFQPLAANEIIVSRKIALLLNARPGDTVYLNADFYDQYAAYFIEYDFNKKGRKYNVTNYNATAYDELFIEIRQATPRYYAYVVKDVLNSSYGKFPDSALDSAVIVEQAYLFQNLAFWSWDAPFLQAMYTADPSEFADEIMMNLKDRFDVYMTSNYDNIQSEVTQIASKIDRDLGVYPINLELPVLNELYNSRYGELFLGIILNMIIVVLFLLSVILLYTLLLVSVETKTYDLGVLRVLGFNKLGVVIMVITQALSYVLPAIIAGVAVSFPLLVYAAEMLKDSIGASFSPTPTPNALLLGIGLGLLIPLASSYVPIKAALKQQLSFALDLSRSKSQAVKISIDLEGKSLPWGLIQFGVIASVFGICVYYFLPLALLSLNINLLLAIFFFILCGMLLGLVILAFNIQYLMEKLLVKVLLCWVGVAKQTMIIKNLASHRIKNRRTALMYSLSLAFVIFIYVGMSVQIGNQYTQTLQQHGCYMEITAKGGSYLPIFDLESMITQLNNLGKYIDDWAWVTVPLDQFMINQGFQTVYATHLGQIYQYRPKIYGVSPSIFQLGFNQFLQAEQTSDTGLDPVEHLYTEDGHDTAIVATSFANLLDLSVDDKYLIVAYNASYSVYNEISVSAIMTTAPAVHFSGLPSVTVQDMLVSLPTFRQLSDGYVNYYEQFPMQRLLLKFGREANKDIIYQQFSQLIRNNGIYAKIWDYRDYQSSIEQSQSLISIIFNALTIIVMFLCFFSLMTSMASNMLEQVKEIAVLRAIGNTKLAISAVYIAEASILVLSSSIIGLIIGFIVGQSMALQQTLFTQLPLVFVFPWQMLIVVVIVSMVAGFISVIVPARSILKHEIAQIMRLN